MTNKTIEKIIDGSKKALVSLSLIGLVGCGGGYIKREYNGPPDQQAKIALYNIEELLRINCRKGYLVTKDFMICKQIKCLSSERHSYQIGGGTHSFSACTNSSLIEEKIKFEYVFSAKVGRMQVKLGPLYKIDCVNQKYAEDLAEAVNVYLKKRQD